MAFTGKFTRVGSTTQFGVSEWNPTGIAARNNTLYLIGSQTDALYTLAYTGDNAGRATRVGSVTKFGVNEDYCRGLAFIGSTLYMFGNRKLYTLEYEGANAGRATEIASTTVSVTGVAAIGTTLYVLDDNNNRLGTIEYSGSNAGRITHIGDNASREFGFGVGELQPSGLAAVSGALYMVGHAKDRLYYLDKSTGLAVPTGHAIYFDTREPSPEALTAINSDLYMLGNDANALYIAEKISTAPVHTAPDTAVSIEEGETLEIDLATRFRGVTAYSLEGSNESYVNLNNSVITIEAPRLNADANITLNYRASNANGNTDIAEPVSIKNVPIGWTAPPEQIVNHGAEYSIDLADYALSTTTYALQGTNESYVSISGSVISFTAPEVTSNTTITINIRLDNDEDSHVDRSFNVLIRRTIFSGKISRLGGVAQFGAGERYASDITAIGDTVYFLGSAQHALYTLEYEGTDIGEITQVGSQNEYGLINTRGAGAPPGGIASIGDTLYLAIGAAINALHTLEYEGANAGKATKVGSATRFGVDQYVPISLASIGNTLYMAGYQPNALYTIDTNTGIATRVGNVENFGLEQSRLFYIFSLDNKLYATTYTGYLYTIEHTGDNAGRAFRISDEDNILLRGFLRGTAVIDNIPYAVGDSGSVYIIEKPPPVYTAPDSQVEVNEGETITIDLATRYSGAEDYSLKGTPPTGVTIDGSIITVVAQRVNANSTITINYRATNNKGNTHTDNSETIEIINIPLAWTAPTGQMVNAGASYRLDLADHSEGATTYALRGSNESYVRLNGSIISFDAPNVSSDTTITINASIDNPEESTQNISFSVQIEASSFTGEFTRVGTVDGFGVSENNPTGLGAIGTTLYLVGQNQDSLFTLEYTGANAGRATRIGGNIADPSGLAAIDNTLYMVSNTTDALYIINTTTGISSRIGSATNFGQVNESGPYDLAAIGNTLYMIGSGHSALYTLDRDTGVATRVGTATRFGVGETGPRGLTAVGNTLYMVGRRNDNLYTLDTTTGEATRVGNIRRFDVNLSEPTGLATIGGNLYMVGRIRSGTTFVGRLYVANKSGAPPTYTAPVSAVEVNEGATTTINLAARYSGAGTITYSLLGTHPDYITISGSTITIVAPNVAADTTITINYRGANAGGNIDRSETVTIKALAPRYTAPPAQLTVDEGNTITIDLADRYTDATSYALRTPTPAGVTLSGSIITIVAPQVTADTTLTINYSGTNTIGTTNNSETVLVNATPPVWTAPPAQSVVSLESYSIDLAGHSKGATSYSLQGANERYVNISGSVISFTAPHVPSNTNITINARLTNTEGDTDITFSVAITAIAPIHTPPETQISINESESIQIDIATRYTGATSYSYPGSLPTHVTLVGNIITISAPRVTEDTSITITYRGSNSAGNTDNTETVLIKNVPLEWTEPTGQSVNSGETYSIDLADHSKSLLSYQIRDPHPTGISISLLNTAISFTAPAVTSNTVITINVRIDSAIEDSEDPIDGSFQVTIKPPPPTYTAPVSAMEVNEGESATIDLATRYTGATSAHHLQA